MIFLLKAPFIYSPPPWMGPPPNQVLGQALDEAGDDVPPTQCPPGSAPLSAPLPPTRCWAMLWIKQAMMCRVHWPPARACMRASDLPPPQPGVGPGSG